MRRFDLFLVMLLIFAIILSSCVVRGDRESLYTSNETYSAFIHVNVIPMTQEIILDDQTVLIAGDRILAIGPTNRVSIPPDAKIVDGDGTYLMPGLADMHMHTNQNWDSDVWPVSPLTLYLANGVTTIRDFGPSGDKLTYALQWREEIQAGTRNGPTIYTSGKILFVSPLVDPAGLVEENHLLGFDFVKLYSYLTPEDTRDALRATNELGMYSAGHIPYTVGLAQVLEYGIDEIAHIEELMSELLEFDRDQRLSPDGWLQYLIQSAMAQLDLVMGFNEEVFAREHHDAFVLILEELSFRSTPICTTLVVDEVLMQKAFDLGDLLDHPESAYLPTEYIELLRSGMEKHQIQLRGKKNLAPYKYGIDQWLLRQLHQAGIPLLLGTDSGVLAVIPGYSIHDELRILVENGFSPYEAIATGTINAAAVVEKMVGDGDIGTIEVGKRADLLLMNENPLEDISAIQDLRGVMAGGRWYSREVLDQMVSLK